MGSGGWCVSVGWSYLACASLDPSMHAFRSSFACFIRALCMHLDMFSEVNLYGVGSAILLGLIRFLMGGCGLLVCRLSQGMIMVVSRFFIGPFDSFNATSAMLCVFLPSDRWVFMIVPCVILL